MKDLTLSKKANDVLEDNGYHFTEKDNVITIKHRSGIMGLVVLLIITLFLSIPLFSAGVIYGLGLIVLVIAIVFIRRFYFSKRSMLQIDTNKNTFSAKFGTYYEEDQPLSMISSMILHSQFVDKYVTAARNEVEEHLISIKIQLITKEEVTLFQLKSDQAEPTEGINEIYTLLEGTVKGAKAA
ncbi:MAG: hypothetical protein AAF391_05135 [Bacteroidota bacterium]